MTSRWAALMAVLALGALLPAVASAQEPQAPQQATDKATPPPPPPKPPPPRSPGVVLGQNSPNPFSQTTVIPFVLGDPPTCNDGGRQYEVTLRIYNVLAQLVAIPVLQSGEFASGQPVVNLVLRCGNYTAFWNGLYLNTSQPVPPGVYLYRIEVDGRAVARKMVVIR
jgi:hypothetical protein